MPIPLLLALLSASAAVRFGTVIISLNVQIFAKSFRKEFENSTSRGTSRIVQLVAPRNTYRAFLGTVIGI